jgi:hypothetical protein
MRWRLDIVLRVYYDAHQHLTMGCEEMGVWTMSEGWVSAEQLASEMLEPETAEQVETVEPMLEDLLAKAERTDQLDANVKVLTEQVESVRAQLREVYSRFDQFKRDVVAEAETVAEEMGWCYDGLREHLANLGLEPTPRTYSGSFQITVYVQDLELRERDSDIEETVRYAFDGPEWSGTNVGEVTHWEFDNINLEQDEN